MLYQFITPILLPLLLPQAVWVKRTTMQLPEAFGERMGYCGSGNELKLLILGDSAAAGVGVDLQEEALSGQLSSFLGENHSVSWLLVANSGYTSKEVLNKLDYLKKDSFDFVLISVGVNDVTHFTSSTRWINNLTAIVTQLTSKFGAKKILFSSIPPMQFFSALPQPLRWWLGQRAVRLNKLLDSVTKQQAFTSTLTIDTPFQQEYIAKDGFHPSAITYRLWAKKAADWLTAQ